MKKTAPDKKKDTQKVIDKSGQRAKGDTDFVDNVDPDNPLKVKGNSKTSNGTSTKADAKEGKITPPVVVTTTVAPDGPKARRQNRKKIAKVLAENNKENI